MPELNYYEILGVTQKTSKVDIRKAYRKMAELYHPDMLDSADPKLVKLATEEMILINEAKDILLDNNSRREYDIYLRTTDQTQYRPNQENSLIRTIIQAQNILSDVKSQGIRILEAEKYFFQAKYAFHNRYYHKGLKLLKYAVISAREKEYENTVEKILRARRKIMSVEMKGYNVESAKNILMQAKPAIQEGMYKEAQDFAKGALEAIKRILEIQTPVPLEPEITEPAKPSRLRRDRKEFITRRDDMVKGIEEVRKMLISQKAISRLDMEKMERLKDFINEMRSLIEGSFSTDRNLSKLEIAFRYKTRMITFQKERELEKEIISSIRNKYEGKVPGIKDIDFSLDVEDLGGVDEKDIPTEDKEIIEPAWDEDAKAKKAFVYKAVLEQAWDDGIVTNDEDAMLRRLRESLDLTDDEHKNIEKEIIKKALLDDYT